MYSDPDDYWKRYYDPYKGMSGEDRAKGCFLEGILLLIGVVAGLLFCHFFV